jgi:hypothetical protein
MTMEFQLTYIRKGLKMKQEIAERWVKALRSGDYEQAFSKLTDGVGYCCLGVLCHLYDPKLFKEDGTYMERDKDLPRAVRAWSGVRGEMGNFYNDEKRKGMELAWLNDRGNSFRKIASIIEENWEYL